MSIFSFPWRSSQGERGAENEVSVVALKTPDVTPDVSDNIETAHHSPLVTGREHLTLSEVLSAVVIGKVKPHPVFPGIESSTYELYSDYVAVARLLKPETVFLDVGRCYLSSEFVDIDRKVHLHIFRLRNDEWIIDGRVDDKKGTQLIGERLDQLKGEFSDFAPNYREACIEACFGESPKDTRLLYNFECSSAGYDRGYEQWLATVQSLPLEETRLHYALGQGDTEGHLVVTAVRGDDRYMMYLDGKGGRTLEHTLQKLSGVPAVDSTGEPGYSYHL